MPNWVANYLTIDGKDSDKVLKNYLIKNNEHNWYQFDFNKIIPKPNALDIISGSITDNCISVYLDSLSNQEAKEKIKLIYDNAIFPQFIKSKNYQKTPIDINKIVKDLIATTNNYNKSNEPAFKTKKDIINYGKQAIDNIIQYGALDWYDWSIKNWGTKWNACNTTFNDKFPNEVWFNTAWNDVRKLIQEMSKKHPNNTFYYTYSEEQIGYYDGKSTFKNGKILEDIQYTDLSKEAYENSFFMWGGENEFHFNDKKGTYEYIGDENYDDTEM